MKNYNKFLMVFLSVLVSSNIFSQNPQWIVYDTTNSDLPSQMVFCIALDDADNKWIGSHTYTGLGFNTKGDGLVKFDGNNWTIFDTLNSDIPTNTIRSISIGPYDQKWIGTGWAWTGFEFIREKGVVVFDYSSQWVVFDSMNSGLPSNDISCVTIDQSNNIWIGTGNNNSLIWPGKGLAKLYGFNNWDVYDTSNSDIPSNNISCIAIDDSNNKWIGTFDEGIAKFDGSQWTLYDSLNSGLPCNAISCIAIDNYGNSWVGTGPVRPAWPSGKGLAKFDGTNWVVYDTSNSELPSNHISNIVIDEDNNKWIGTYEGGLAKFSDTSWTLYDPSNSGLPDSWINCIVIDRYGNKWIGTGWGGLVVFNESGVVSVEKDETFRSAVVKDYILFTNYPNPFNPTTTIEFLIPKTEYVTLKIYNLLGQEVASLVSDKLNSGAYQYIWDAGNLASGVYFYQLQAGDPSTGSGQSIVKTKKMILLK